MGKKRRGNTVNDFAKEYGRTMIVCRPQFILLLDIAGSLSRFSCFRIIDDRSQTEEERKRNFGIVKRIRLQLKERERKADATKHGNSDARKINGIRTLRRFTGIFFPLITPSSPTAIHHHHHRYHHHLIVIVIVRCFFVPSSFCLSLSLIHSLAYSFVPSFTRVSLFPSLFPLSLSLWRARVN